MSYTPTEWKSGDTITSAKLNKMEQGIAAGGSGGGVLVVHGSDDDNPVLDKTWQEIKDAYDADGVVIMVNSYGDICYMSTVPASSEGTYYVGFFSSGGTDNYTTNSASGYPTWTQA